MTTTNKDVFESKHFDFFYLRMYSGMLRYLDNRAEKIDYIMSTKNVFYDEIRSSIEEVCFKFILTLQHF